MATLQEYDSQQGWNNAFDMNGLGFRLGSGLIIG